MLLLVLGRVFFGIFDCGANSRELLVCDADGSRPIAYLPNNNKMTGKEHSRLF